VRPLVAQLLLLVDVLAAPRDAVRVLGERSPVGGVLAVLGVLQAVVLIAQGWFLQAAVLGDPLLAGATGGPEAIERRYWIVRGVAVLLGPAASLLRGAALATVVQACSAWCGIVLSWRALLSLALHLDVVFWLESLCLTLVLAIHPPAALDDLFAVRVRAGLDALWQPESRSLSALLAAANLFTVWWACLVGLALAAWMRARRRVAFCVALGLWLGLVGLRMVTTAR
jgi:hypothetical protein